MIFDSIKPHIDSICQAIFVEVKLVAGIQFEETIGA